MKRIQMGFNQLSENFWKMMNHNESLLNCTNLINSMTCTNEMEPLPMAQLQITPGVHPSLLQRQNQPIVACRSVSPIWSNVP